MGKQAYVAFIGCGRASEALSRHINGQVIVRESLEEKAEHQHRTWLFCHSHSDRIHHQAQRSVYTPCSTSTTRMDDFLTLAKSALPHRHFVRNVCPKNNLSNARVHMCCGISHRLHTGA